MHAKKKRKKNSFCFQILEEFPPAAPDLCFQGVISGPPALTGVPEDG